MPLPDPGLSAVTWQQVEAFAGSQKPSSKKWTSKRGALKGRERSRFLIPLIGTEAGPFASQLNGEPRVHQSRNDSFYVPTRREEEVELTVSFSSAALDAGGRALLHTSLVSGRNHADTFKAPNYDALADGPIEIGKIDVFDLPEVTPR